MNYKIILTNYIAAANATAGQMGGQAKLREWIQEAEK